MLKYIRIRRFSMKMKRVIILALLVIIALAVAGCTTTTGGSTDGPTATTTTITTTTQQSGPGPGTDQQCSRATVSAQVLANFLPEAQSGGQADEPLYANNDIPGAQCQYAATMNSYDHGEKNVVVAIYDFNYYTGVYGDTWGNTYDTGAGYANAVTIHGYSAWEVVSMNPLTTYYTLLWVDCGNGIMAQIYVEGTWFTGLQDQYADVINYDGLAGLA